jgi:hypothetical protein
VIISFQQQLDQRADAKTKAWWERFAQTGAGWVLRELSLADQERVVAFVEERIGQFTREGLAYATEKMPAETQLRLKALRKASR